jgi:hypothetical protein
MGFPDMENYCRKSRPDDVSECISNELIYRGVISSDWAGEPVDVVMRSQLAAHYVNRTVDVHPVLREIGQMEGTDPRRTSTPNGRALAHSLGGLMHKHYFRAPYILLNLINRWSKRSTQVQLRQISDEFDRDGHFGKYLHALVLGGHVARHASRQVAGEWIVFVRFAHANYYLTLASHDEARENQDAIRARAHSCVTEFPELRGQAAFNRTGPT